VTFADPSALLALWAWVPVLLLLLAAYRLRLRALARLGPLLLERMSEGALRLHRLRLGAAAAAVGLLVFALAGPRLGFHTQEVVHRGVDIVVLLDVSRSMDAEDTAPSRMERARRELIDLSEMLVGDRVGLVIFAGGAHPRLPLTLDYGVLRWATRDSATETLLAQGSDLGAAIDMGVALLGPDEGADRSLLILSDGEDQEGEARDAAQRAAEAGVRIFAMGVGTPEGSPIPLSSGGFKKDEGGEVVLSRLDEGLLTELARVGGGAYVRSSAGAADMRAIYEGELRGKANGARETKSQEQVWDERFQWPLGLAFVLLVGAALPRAGRLRLPGLPAALPAVLLGLAVGLGALGSAAGWAAGEDDEIKQIIGKQLEAPDDLGLAERLGGALYARGDYARAREVFDGVAARSQDPEQQARARYNAGLAAYRGGQLTEAAKAWERALAGKPGDPAAQKNLEAVQKEIAARMQQRPPEPPPEQRGQQQPQDGEQGGQDSQPQPQDGQQQPQDGQQGEKDGQQGQPDGQQQPQDGQQQPEDGQPGQQGQQNPQGQQQNGDQQADPSEASPPNDGTMAAKPQPGAPTGDPAGAQADGELKGAEDTGQAEPGEAKGGAPTDRPVPEGMSPDEAARLLDGVPEGSPRVRANRERSGGRDW